MYAAMLISRSRAAASASSFKLAGTQSMIGSRPSSTRLAMLEPPRN
jgi:hypothetical protein